MSTVRAGSRKGGESYKETSKSDDVRMANIVAAKAVADAIRTSLGPRGMDKMIQDEKGEVIITNDGATIMAQMKVYHPTAKMLVELSKAQDVSAGDGTTSVVVLAGSLLNSCLFLLQKGLHPMTIAASFQKAALEGAKVLERVAVPVDLSARSELLKAATTSLSSKVVSQNSDLLAPIAVDAVLSVLDDPTTATNVDLNDIKIVKQVGGTIDDTELVHGLVFTQRHVVPGGPRKVENAKVALIQFCLTAPKTDMENSVVVSDYSAMDRVLRQERKYILQLCKKVKKSGANVLIIQKSILRDAVNDLSLHFLKKLGIMVVKDVERRDIEFISKTLGCKPVAHVDSLTDDKLGSAGLVELEDFHGDGTLVAKFTDVPHTGRTVTVLCRGSNRLVLDEADRSLHDALCVIRSIVQQKFLIAGGGAPETELALQLTKYSHTLKGAEAFCVRAFADAMEVVPYTLAENAGLSPLSIVTELRKRHAEGKTAAGINVRRGSISDMRDENVLQPLRVTSSALTLATECVMMILKIDDVVGVR